MKESACIGKSDRRMEDLADTESSGMGDVSGTLRVDWHGQADRLRTTGCKKTLRLLGLDYGDKTVGVAVSDPLGLTARGVEIIRRKKRTKLRQTLARIGELIAEYEAEGLVLGLPLCADGSEGSRCELTRAFGQMLVERFDLPVWYQDERLTTVEAYEIMHRLGIRRDCEEEHVDEVAAMVLLQDYLNGQQGHILVEDRDRGRTES